MQHVACVCFGDAYSPEYVEILHDMVRRNLAAGFRGRFVVFTDRPELFYGMAGIQTAGLPFGLKGWWNKLALFAPDAFPIGDSVLYFDLDTVITGALDAFVKDPPRFLMLRDAYRPEGLQSSVMAWQVSPETHAIWEEWNSNGRPEVAGGDQNWIELYADRLGITTFQSKYPGSCRSYKKECIAGIPKGTAVVFFHGFPRPHQVTDGWVPQVWKVGGGSSVELVMVPTVPQDELLANAANALAQGYRVLRDPEPPHDGRAIVCAGGPSLAQSVSYVRAMASSGATIFAVNNADAFLRSHGVIPAVHVMVDGRPEMAGMVNKGGTKLYASTCNPSTLERGEELGDTLVIWHPATAGISKVTGPDGLLIAGGTTAGCKAMALAAGLGFASVECVGFDSCHVDGAHHAYAQRLNDNDKVLNVTCNGRDFKAAPWMVQQAEDWRTLAIQLTTTGVTVSVFGDGLIAAVADTMAANGAVNIDGLYWPARDVETRPAVLASLPDLANYISLVNTRGVAVQAGGNVGVWAKELSKHFTKVHTFEPDPLNWHCLQQNVTEANVSAMNVALGDVPGKVGTAHIEGNCGATFIQADGEIPQVRIDDLGLQGCDLLQLDVEGYELKALKGAEQTIRKHSPLIVLELKGHGERYGDSDAATEAWLGNLGYKRAGTAHRDVIYMKEAA